MLLNRVNLLSALEEEIKKLKAKGNLYSIPASVDRKARLDVYQILIDKINAGEFDLESPFISLRDSVGKESQKYLSKMSDIIKLERLKEKYSIVV